MHNTGKQRKARIPNSIASYYKGGFNELDNWLEIMDLDPPSNEREKEAMYTRLLDILEDMFVCKKKQSSKHNTPKRNKRPSKAQIHSEMQRIIGV